MKLCKKELGGKTFYYIIFDNPDKIVWVNKKFIKIDEEGKETLQFPLHDAELVETMKGNTAIRPGNGIIYRMLKGDFFRIVSPERVKAIEFAVEALVWCPEKVPLKIERIQNRELYKEPKTKTETRIYYPDGREEEGIDDEELIAYLEK